MERQFGFILSKKGDMIPITNWRNYTKKIGFCKNTGKQFIVWYQSELLKDGQWNISAPTNVVRLFEDFTKLQSKYIQGYEKFLVLNIPQQSEKQVMLISEVVNGVNVNNLVGDLGDTISVAHHKAVTTSLRELMKIHLLTDEFIEKPKSFLQENGEIKCVFSILEALIFHGNTTSRLELPMAMRTLSRRNSRNVQDLYKTWYGDNGRLQRDFKDLLEIGKGGFGCVYRVNIF